MQAKDGQSAKSGGANAVISVVGLSSQQVASFVITILAAGFLTPAEYGVYTLAIVFVEFVVMLTYTGYFHYLVNASEDEDRVLSTMFWMMVGIGTLGGATLVLLAGPIARLFDAPELAPVLRLFGFLQPFASLIGWASAVLTRAGLMRRYFLVLAISNLGGLAAGCLLLIVWQSLFALVAYRAARIALGLLLFTLSLPRRPRFGFDRGMAWRSTRYAVGLYGARFLNFFSVFGTDLILALIFSTAEAGLYRFANRLATGTVDIIAQPLRIFALKSFGAAARSSAPLSPLLTRYLGTAVFLTGGFALTIVVLGRPLVETLFQPDYLAALGALYALGARAAFLSGNMFVEPVFAARHTTSVAMYHNLIWTSVMLTAIIIAAPFGYTMLAAVQAVVALMTSVAAVWVMGRWGQIDVRPALRGAARAAGLLALYGCMLALAWTGLAASVQPGLPLLAIGAATALALAALTSAFALRTRVVDLRIFVD
ncbi:MAG: oligosaccharide flippase family protein [Pseudomonadota bacterium]